MDSGDFVILAAIDIVAVILVAGIALISDKNEFTIFNFHDMNPTDFIVSSLMTFIVIISGILLFWANKIIW